MQILRFLLILVCCGLPITLCSNDEELEMLKIVNPQAYARRIAAIRRGNQRQPVRKRPARHQLQPRERRQPPFRLIAPRVVANMPQEPHGRATRTGEKRITH